LTKNDWENWIFSDECPIYLFPTPNSQNDRIYSQSRENFQPSEQVKFSHVMVWGAMSASGLTDLHMVPQGTTVNAQYYIDNILETELLPALKRTKRSGPAIECKMTKKHAESVFVQDGAPAHTVKVTQRWCSENLSAFLKKDELPPNSPDLNPVENLWAILNQKVFHTPSSHHHGTTKIKKLEGMAEHQGLHTGKPGTFDAKKTTDCERNERRTFSLLI
jgi:transposase